MGKNIDELIINLAANRISRRDFVKKAAVLGLSMGAIGSILAACGSAATPAATETAAATATAAATETAAATATAASTGGKIGGEITVMTWEVKYDPELYAEFEAQTGTKLNMVYIAENEEVFNKLKASGSSGFDVIMGDATWPLLYRQQGYLETLDMSKIPNAKNLYPEFQPETLKGIHTDDKGVFGVSHSWGNILMQYDTEAVPTVTGWKDLWDEKYSGKISMMSWMLATIPTAAMMLGFSLDDPFKLTDDQLAKVKDSLLKQKPMVRKYWETDGDNLTMWDNREIVVGMSTLQATVKANEDLGKEVFKAFSPPEGTVGWLDAWGIGVGSKNQEAAYAFINWFEDASVQARLTEKIKQTTCNKAARDLLVSQGKEALVKQLGLDDLATYKTVKLYGPIDDTAAKKWTAMWDEILAA
jgi:spermidine/putrescine-binding protein